MNERGSRTREAPPARATRERRHDIGVTLARDARLGCGRSAAIQLFAIVIGLPLGLCGVMSTLWLITTFDFSLGVLIFVAFLWLLPLLVSIVVFVVVVRRRATKIDALFVPLGLVGGPYMSYFRQYHGTVSARQVDIYLWRGPTLLIEVETQLCARLGVTGPQVDTEFLAGLAGKQPLTLSDPNLAALSVYADDQIWARSLLANTTATDALRRLTAADSTIFTRQQVILRPGAFQLMLRGNRKLFGFDLTAPQASLLVQDLIRVVEIAEMLPAPQVAAELLPVEQFAINLRKRNPYFELWMALGILGFFAVAAVVIFAGVFLFTGMGG